MANGTQGLNSPAAIREKTVDGLHKPIQAIIREADRAALHWRRRDLDALGAALRRLQAAIDSYVQEDADDGST
jgi:hypothetical protein